MKVLQRRVLYRFVLLVAFLFAAHASVPGGIRPSFLSQDSTWRATDIVVVTEGTHIDGVVQVVETLKGELKSGTTLTLPDLAEFKANEARLIHKFGRDSSGPDQFVTGNRMILFLRDQTKIPAGDEEQATFVELERTPARWSGANPMAREVRYSTVWLEGEKAYAFYQIVNPGPSLLTSTLTEAQFRKLIATVSGEQAALNAAAAIVEPRDRAEALKPFIHSAIHLARKTAFVRLTECGTAALPVLRAELENSQDQILLAEVIEAFAKAGGREAGPVSQSSWPANWSFGNKQLRRSKPVGGMAPVSGRNSRWTLSKRCNVSVSGGARCLAQSMPCGRFAMPRAQMSSPA